MHVQLLNQIRGPQFRAEMPYPCLLEGVDTKHDRVQVCNECLDDLLCVYMSVRSLKRQSSAPT